MGRARSTLHKSAVLGYVPSTLSIRFGVGKPHTKTFMRVPVANWKVPCGTAVRPVRVSCRVPLNLSAKKISWAERDLFVDAFIVDECREVVIHNMAAIPATKEARLEELQLVISHLIVRYQHWPFPAPPPTRIISRDVNVSAASSHRLIRYTRKHPVVIVEASFWHGI